MAGAGGDGGEEVEEFLAQFLDLGGVGGVVHRDPSGLDAVGLAACGEGVEFLGGAGDDDLFGAVDDGDLQTRREVFADALLGGEDGEHAAAAGEADDGAAAQGDDPCGVVQGEGAGDVGGGDLALGVADDGGGLDAQGAPEFGQRDHDGEQHGLDDVDPVEGVLVVVADHVEQRPAVGERLQRGGALGHLLGEHR